MRNEENRPKMEKNGWKQMKIDKWPKQQKWPKCPTWLEIVIIAKKA